MVQKSMTLVIPARNEALYLERVLVSAHAALPAATTLVLADSASEDGTAEVVHSLLSQLPYLRYIRVERPGKGLAVREGWKAFPADYLAFMDADLATDLATLGPLNAALARADLAIGNRHHALSHTERPWLRQWISRGFNTLLRLRFPEIPYTDTTCGFKAIRAEVYWQMAEHLQNERWFFDTELLLHAHWQGFRVRELAVRWREDTARRTSVNIARVAREYWQELNRLSRLPAFALVEYRGASDGRRAMTQSRR